MGFIVVYHSQAKDFPLFKFQKELDLEVFSLESEFELEDYAEEEDCLIICEAKLYFAMDKNIIAKLESSSNKIVLTSEFSESYMFDKALSSKCDDFIVNPFGIEEFKLLFKRLDVNQ